MKAAVARIANRILARTGYTAVATWRLERLEQANYLRRLFATLGIDGVIDVGANVGQYRDFLRNDVGFRGDIVSFEPVPTNVETLRQRAAQDSRWIIQAKALGSARDVKTFNVMKHSALSSFLHPDHTHFEFQLNRIDHEIEVEVDTLDNVLPGLIDSHGWRSVYLKLDTQGYDLEVMKGATGVVSAIRALQTEASIRPIYRGMPSFADSIAKLQETGFEVSGIFATNYEAFPMLLEVDCHMVSRSVCKRTESSVSSATDAPPDSRQK